MNEETNFQQEYEKGRSQAMGFASAVYTGAVFAATIIFLFFVLTAFPSTAYLIRGLMVLAGLLVGASALSFPVALHNWAVTGNHRLAATIFYYGEIFLIVLNTVVSFSTLLFKYAGNAIPDWVAWYEPFTIFSLGYVVLAWGTIFIMDPQAKAKARKKAVHDNFIIKVAEDMERWTQSVEGKKAVQEAALQEIVKSFQVKPDGPQHWIEPEKTKEETLYRRSFETPELSPYKPVISNKPQTWVCPSCTSNNLGDGMFCGACGSPRFVQVVSKSKGNGANP